MMEEALSVQHPVGTPVNAQAAGSGTLLSFETRSHASCELRAIGVSELRLTYKTSNFICSNLIASL